MNSRVDSSSDQNAVIESRCTDRHAERFVLAYYDQGSPRELLAAPSIVAIGFTSREDAMKRIEASAEARGIVRRSLQHAIAASILIFYSRNITSTAIRTLLGA